MHFIGQVLISLLSILFLLGMFTVFWSKVKRRRW